MNILAIGAHPDDIEFLCAGTLALYAKQGHKIFIAVATNGNVGSPTLSKTEISEIRKNECLQSCKLINAKLIWMNFDDEWLYDTPESRNKFIDAIEKHAWYYGLSFNKDKRVVLKMSAKNNIKFGNGTRVPPEKETICLGTSINTTIFFDPKRSDLLLHAF